MKLGLSPALRTSAVTLRLILFFAALFAQRTPAEAAPRRAFAGTAHEDAVADGDLDQEDLDTSPLSALEGAGSGRPVLGRARGSTWVSLVGFSRQAFAGERQEIGGMLVVGLPLERFARANTRMTTTPLDTLGPELASARAREPAALQNVSMTDAPFELALTPRLARSCVTAAWRAAGLGADDGRLDAIVSRARWSSALPEARLRAVRTDDARLSLDTTTATDTSRLRDSTGANVGFEARLTWRFDRLIYADDEPAFERIRLEHRDARARIGAKVLEALFHWQRAALALRALPPAQQGTRDEADVRLRLMEAEAALDVLTNGWFAANKARYVRAPETYAAPVPLGRPSPGDL
ncbi:MAG: hypothetical protein KF894_03475 [Labilithrix sp.]|nr:hypothetical protein [Labilithrix sp.]